MADSSRIHPGAGRFLGSEEWIFSGKAVVEAVNPVLRSEKMLKHWSHSPISSTSWSQLKNVKGG